MDLKQKDLRNVAEAVERKIGWLRLEPGGTMEIRLLSVVTEDVWDEFQKLIGTQARIRPYLLDFMALESEFQAVIRAHVEYAEGIALSVNPAFWPLSHQFVQLVQVQRHVSNFLGSASAFRERMSTRLRSEGRASLSAEIVQHTNDLYDRNFAYRLMYNLRNYAQHHDLPIGVTNVNIANVSGSERDVAVKFAIDGKELLKSTRIQAKVRSEIEALHDPHIELLAATRTFFQCHVLLMRHWLLANQETFRGAFQYKSAVERTLVLPEGALPVIFEGEMPNPSIRHFAFDELDLWTSLSERLLEDPILT